MTRATTHVGLDIDGVLCDHVAGLCHRIRQAYAVQLTPEMVTEWDLDFGPSSIARELESAYEDDEFVISLPPLEGAQEAVSRLERTAGLGLTAVTSRPVRTRAATIHWLEQHFGGLRVEYRSEKELVPADVLLDDFPPFVERFAGVGKQGVLFARPWNAGDRNRLRVVARIQIAKDWPDAVGLIKSLSRELVAHTR